MLDVLQELRDDESDAKPDCDDDRAPRYIIIDPRVDVLSHDVLVVDDEEHVDQHKRKQNAVDDLRDKQH